jgi:sulfur carrier protein
MKVFVNGSPREIVAPTLEGALRELGYGSSTVATALNGEFVAVGRRSDTTLSGGDRVEVLAPMQGG